MYALSLASDQADDVTLSRREVVGYNAIRLRHTLTYMVLVVAAAFSDPFFRCIGSEACQRAKQDVL